MNKRPSSKQIGLDSSFLMSNSERNYAKLRSWYLARLRQEANSRRDLTPSALIKADTEVIEKMISDKAAEPKSLPSTSQQETGWLPLKLWSIVLPLAPIVLVIPPLLYVLSILSKLDSGLSSLPDAEHQITVAVAAALCVTITVAIMSFVIFRREILQPLSRVKDNLLKLLPQTNGRAASDKEISEVSDLVARLSRVLDEAVERERAIADYALELICSLDAEGRCTAISQASMRIWGYHPQEVIGKKISSFVLAEDVEKTEQALSQVRSAQPRTSIENRIVHRNGHSVDMIWSIDWSQSDKSTYCVGRDISMEKELERMKEEFLAMIGHDLRTPLTAIYSALGVLNAGVAGTLTDEGRKVVGMSLRSSEHLMSLINDILDIEKLRAGKLSIKMKEAAIHRVVKRSTESVTAFAQQHKITINVRCHEALCWGDEDRLVQVLINLLSNAIKFSPEGGHIRVDVLSNHEAVEVKVTDDGPGIPPEFQASIFERYNQLARVKSTRLAGSGLGLAICKEIIQRHGGIIGVVSNEGQGSTFWFRVPAYTMQTELSK